MLPLGQMHLRAVPPPVHLDTLDAGDSFESLAALPSHGPLAADPSTPRDGGASQQWSFPIRTSLPQSRAAVPSTSRDPLRPEHRLRRKTPNGTIDAGYDGSPTQPFPGPPPPKHMILSVSAGATLYPTPAPSLYPPHLGLAQDNFPSSHGHHPTQPPDLAAASPWLYESDCLPYSDSRHLAQAMPLQYQSNLSPEVHQPLARPGEHNVRAFCPPPGYVNDHFGQMGWQPAYSPWAYMGYGQSQAVQSSNRRPSRGASIHRYPSEHLTQAPFGRPADTAFPFVASGRAAHQDMHTLTTLMPNHEGSNRTSAGYAGQPRFIEKALSQAHRSYTDLVASVQTGKKSTHAKNDLGQREFQAPTRLLVYPKPPQPTFTTPRPLYEPGSAVLNRADQPHYTSNSQALRMFPSRQGLPLRGFTGRHDEHVQYSEKNDEMDGSNLAKPPNRMGQGITCVAETGDYPMVPGKSSPAANAKSSLEILDHLCDQSGWKWVEGMLLGGCLHYGLEHYEDALRWFSRIVALDSRHVEAIANLAATLYCLNRRDEAEKNWLKAIKLRPSYLDAAEHLVGLLYKERSEEAVEVITFVQQALRINAAESTRPTGSKPVGAGHAGSSHIGSSSGSANRHPDNEQMPRPRFSTETGPFGAYGHGSSGYALPASENGRILALVHAKGTMLYSLKDIKRASQAFEEAVLISVGRRMTGIQDLVRRIQAVLSPMEGPSALADQRPHMLQPLLLVPERARHTARLVFAADGGTLPGLSFVPSGIPKRAAAQTTSNSLLSLAKIFQDSMSTGSADPGLLHRPSGVGDILALYYLSLSLQESPSTANNVGILLAGVQQAVSTSSLASADSPTRPSIPGITPGSGLDLALAYYHYGLRLDPKHVHLHTNLGSLLKDIGQLDLAIRMYERAVSCDGTFDIALTNLANAVKDRGRITDAITYYRRAVSSNPDFAEAVCGLLTALNSVCDWHSRGGVVLGSGKYDRWHVDDKGMLLDSRSHGRGSGLTQRVTEIVGQQLREASQWGRNTLRGVSLDALARQLRPVYGGPPKELDEALRKWAGQPWEGSRVVRLIERATRTWLRRWYLDLHGSGGKAASRRYSRPRLPSSLIVPPAPTVLPFHTFTTPLDAKDIRAISQRNALRISCSTLRSPWLPAALYPPPSPPNPHLNIGYVSSDFNNHPLAHLMQSVFGFHDVRRARAFCYATTASDRSAHRQKIEREAPIFRDVSSWPPEKLVEQIVKDEIHILVNLNGYTRGARNEVFAARPAPIQMSFMGFAGTLGAEWCDYILADTTAIPCETLRPWRNNVSVEDVFHDGSEVDGQEWMYSENIIFCRDTFFCCDHAQSGNVDERTMTWEGEERRRWKMRRDLFPALPEDTIILANFNQLYKIEPTTFRCWLRVLARVPKAVLWLLRFPEVGESNLRETAKSWAGAEVASRLLFTDVAPKSQHISRARVCDLFLDTPECNAHTTAADVLWSSTPLLTLPRYPYKMCSRMAASILKGALPKSAEGGRVAAELIARSEAEYEQTAIRLAGDLSYRTATAGYGQGRGRLAEMRRVLWKSKWSCGLFDTRRWVSDVERAYEEAWRRWVAGEGGDIYL